MFTKNFRELSKNDADIAGGKGASLGEMITAGIPVPDGFVVLTEAFENFLAETDLKQKISSELEKVEQSKIHTVEYASKKIQGMILGADMPADISLEIKNNFKKLGAQWVAVRSSATAEDGAEAAWAGQLDSFLNTTKDSLLENVKKCWASLFTPRAIFYRFEKYPLQSPLTKGGSKGGYVSVAVAVQKMIQSEKSGIAFSVHPVTEDYNQLIVEAGYGLGEAIVSGSITPDSYVVEKDSKNIIDTNINTQIKALYRACHLDRSPSLDDLGRSGGISANEWRDIPEPQASSQVLSKKEILELSDLIIKIENHYGFPCDIEWAQEKGKFYITQSRPITTLKKCIKEDDFNGLDLVKNNKFYNQITYSFIPVICFESTMRSYLDNPLQGKLNIKEFPKVIEFLTDSFEGWDDQNIQKITDTNLIKYIIKESRDIIKHHNSSVENLLKIKYLKLDNDEFIESIKLLDKICTEVYQRYIYFIHEFFKTDDEVMIKVLPEVRIELSDFVSKIYEICDRFIKALAERFKSIPWQTFTYATFDEIIHLLENPQTIKDFEKINKRSIVFIFNGLKLVVVKEDDEVQKIINFLKSKEEKIGENINELKGIIGFKGKVKGRVTRFLESDYEKINTALRDKKDYILVLPMTRPEVVPYLKNCKAIITDEGGITCHAAIVARELQIPCIIGTKIATQVLKDGDDVEVDASPRTEIGSGADNGVVRVLK